MSLGRFGEDNLTPGSKTSGIRACSPLESRCTLIVDGGCAACRSKAPEHRRFFQHVDAGEHASC
jgi:hypothetical protein